MLGLIREKWAPPASLEGSTYGFQTAGQEIDPSADTWVLCGPLKKAL